MAILTFTLSPDALGKLHDALVCLGKFSEAVAIEASHDKLVLTALNSSKSAYSSFTLAGSKFFEKYQYKPIRIANQPHTKFNCRIYNKALQSVFKARPGDSSKDRETAIERCDCSVEDGEGKTKSRFVIKIICRHGVIKTYRLTFESVAPMHAQFIKESAHNHWSISSKTLREFVEHFGPGTEQLDIYSEDGRVSLTSYTEKIMSGSEILKQPLHTTIAIDILEFAEFAVEEQLHIVISVKDFKSIITHASTNNTIVKALYSHPSSPMQFTYSNEGILCEFILMTIGEVRGNSTTPASAANASRAGSKRPGPKQSLDEASSSKRAAVSGILPPLPRGSSLIQGMSKKKVSRPSPPPPQPSVQDESLFVPQGTMPPAVYDDRQWDPLNFDDEDGKSLQWGQEAPMSAKTMKSGGVQYGEEDQEPVDNVMGDADYRTIPTQRIAPTQRFSQVPKGLFDD